MPMGKKQPPMERFWPKTRVEGDCIVWIGARRGRRTGKNHGVIGVGPRKVARTHRFLYEQALGPIPPGKVVRHTCDNPPCVKLQHLEIGTVAQNNADMDQRGRRVNAQPSGEAHWKCKLSDAQVAEIRARYAAGERQADLARAFGISRPHVSSIVRGKSRR